MPRKTFEPWALLRFHRWSNRFRPGSKIRFTAAFLSGRHFGQFISASRGGARRLFPLFLSPLLPSFLFRPVSFAVYSRGPKTWLKNEMLSSRRISHVSIAQRFTVLSASFPRDFYTACAAIPRPSFPSIHPRFSPRAYFVNHPAKFAPEPDVYGCCQPIPSKCSNDLADIFFFFFFFFKRPVIDGAGKEKSISEKCPLEVSIQTRCDFSKFSNHTACDSIFSARISDRSRYFPQRQPIPLRLIARFQG